MASLRTHLSRVPREGMQEPRGYLRKECSRQWEQHVQRSRGRAMCDLLEEQ